jgi:hypothetical protein
MPVSYECCVLARRGLCVGLIIRPGEFYLVRCEASTMSRFWPSMGCRSIKKDHCVHLTPKRQLMLLDYFKRSPK